MAMSTRTAVSNRDGARLATVVSNPVLHFTCGQNSRASIVQRKKHEARVSAGSTVASIGRVSFKAYAYLVLIQILKLTVNVNT